MKARIYSHKLGVKKQQARQARHAGDRRRFYRAFVTSSFRARCRELAYAYESDETRGAEFREKLDKPKADGGFVTLEATVKDAERLWWEHSPAYQPCRQTAKLSTESVSERQSWRPWRQGNKRRGTTKSESYGTRG
ncbi:Hypp712 [Branchiostoma lanceolatum]|uniref:Hypp712 protein n=1 Tax=Branchiostoma lanceolatum TaxID=7740 RepID=A0A8J9YK71_BRALA|nr:Hypp712 [Branchiostoma lanceolatum]